jgi:hypothetical protein
MNAEAAKRFSMVGCPPMDCKRAGLKLILPKAKIVNIKAALMTGFS